MEIAQCRREGRSFEDRRRFKLSQLPLLINGDDVVFTEKKEDIDVWTRIVTLVGLKPSVGKNYISKHFLMINSRLYKPFDDGKSVDWYFEPFINMGLLSGVSSKKSIQTLLGIDGMRSIGQISHDLTEGFSPLMVGKLMRQFIGNWKSVLRLCHGRQSWYAPVQLGGLGLKVWSRSFYTLEQRMVAVHLASFQSPDLLDYSLVLGNPDCSPQYLEWALKLYKLLIKLNNISVEWSSVVHGDPLFKECVDIAYLYCETPFGEDSSIIKLYDRYRRVMGKLASYGSRLVRLGTEESRKNEWITHSDLKCCQPISLEKLESFDRKSILSVTLQLPTVEFLER
jgi:hypothetical protein